MDKVWEIKDPDELLRSMGKKRIRKIQRVREEKDPAKAYLLSLVLWGSGQLYTDQVVKGIFFMVLNVALLLVFFAFLIFYDRLLLYLRSRGVLLSQMFLFVEILAFFIILFWQYNAGNAYRKAVTSRKTRFRGVTSRISPVLGSLLLPGCGQFLNGQEIKGSVFTGFTVLAYFSILAVFSTYLAWPVLDASDSRFFIDAISAICLLFLPLVPFIWIFGCYDAYRVSRNELLKETVWERIKAANNRRRSQGWVQGVFPQIRSTLVLAALFSCLLATLYLFIPKIFYADRLDDARKYLAGRGMIVVPDLIGRLTLSLRS